MSYNPNFPPQPHSPDPPLAPSPSPFSPEPLPSTPLRGTEGFHGQFFHQSQPQGFNRYSFSPYGMPQYYTQAYSHPHHTPYQTLTHFQQIPSTPTPQPTPSQPRRSVLGEANIPTTTAAAKGKDKAKDTRKRKGTENEPTPPQKRPRSGKNQQPDSTPVPSEPSVQPSQQPTQEQATASASMASQVSDTSQSETTSGGLVPGVGPSEPAIQDSSDEEGDSSESKARDVWIFLRALETKDRPPLEEWPKDENQALSKIPTSKYAGCKLCSSLKKPLWRVFTVNRGLSSTFRRHLLQDHARVYQATRNAMGLPSVRAAVKAATVTNDEQAEKEPFTMDGFIERLIRWIIVDDQSIRVLECQEFRDLLTYISDHLEDADIPHRTKLTNDILNLHKMRQEEMHRELRNAPGRISLTADMWSDPNRVSYMAVTAHWIATGPNGDWSLQTRLLAFTHVKGSHSGANLGTEMYDILKSAGILHKLGSITMDNASNNNTTMSMASGKWLFLL